MLVPKH